MILEYYWIYYLAFFLSGIVFGLPMEKKDGFRQKFGLFFMADLLLGVIILYLPRENVLLLKAVFMALGCVINTLVLHTCFEISWSVSIYNMVWGVSLWEVVIEGTSMLLMLRRAVRPEAPGEAFLILGTYVLTYLLCFCTIK